MWGARILQVVPTCKTMISGRTKSCCVDFRYPQCTDGQWGFVGKMIVINKQPTTNDSPACQADVPNAPRGGPMPHIQPGVLAALSRPPPQ